VAPIWEVASQMLFYVSPILYVTTLVPEEYRNAYMVNPLATLLTEMRAAVVDPAAPHAWDLASPAALALSALIGATAVALGIFIFIRQAPRIAEDL